MSPGLPLICACEDDALYTRALQAGLGGAFRFDFSADGAGLLRRLAAQRPALVLLDLRLGPRRDAALGLGVLAQVRAAWPCLRVVVHSGVEDCGTIAAAMALGAVDFLPKDGDLAAVGARLAAHARTAAGPDPAGAAPAATAVGVDAGAVAPVRARAARGAGTAMPGWVAHSGPAAALAAAVARIRTRRGNVLVVGESGAGKERVAQALAQANQPFVAVDAATLHEGVALSALFGHERGAFTGAASARAGLLERAHGGVLFLDEVANLSLAVQAALLRALAERQVVRLGDSRTRQLAFRVVAATHRDLAALCRTGVFRHDLLARLEVFTLEVPPLRARAADLAELVAALLARMGAPTARPSASLWAWLRAYSWPGNVRELAHALEHAVAMRDDDGPLEPAHLPPRLRGDGPCWQPLPSPPLQAPASVSEPAHGAVAPLPALLPSSSPSPSPPPARAAVAVPAAGSLAGRLHACERQILAEAYAAARHNVAAAARALRVDRTTLHHKLCHHGLHQPRVR